MDRRSFLASAAVAGVVPPFGLPDTTPPGGSQKAALFARLRYAAAAAVLYPNEALATVLRERRPVPESARHEPRAVAIALAWLLAYDWAHLLGVKLRDQPGDIFDCKAYLRGVQIGETDAGITAPNLDDDWELCFHCVCVLDIMNNLWGFNPDDDFTYEDDETEEDETEVEEDQGRYFVNLSTTDANNLHAAAALNDECPEDCLQRLLELAAKGGGA